MFLSRYSVNGSITQNSAWLLHIIGDKASPAARDSSEVTRALTQRCYTHTEMVSSVGVLEVANHGL